MKRIFTIALIASIGALTACGGDPAPKGNDNQEKAAAAPKVAETPKEVEKEVVEITVVAKGETMGEISFEPAVLSVPANSIVKLTLKNESSAAGMLHNFVLVELGSGQEIATAAIAAGNENNFVPDDNRIFAATAMSNMGESVSIEFDAPAKGSYHYICTYPGHYPKMIGRMNVQ